MRTVVITGGSRGIGAAAVRRFTSEGDRVYFLYEKSTELAKAMEQETGAVGIQCDVSDEDAVECGVPADRSGGYSGEQCRDRRL